MIIWNFFDWNKTKYVSVAESSFFQNDLLGPAKSRGNLSVDYSYFIIWDLMASPFHRNFMSVKSSFQDAVHIRSVKGDRSANLFRKKV